MPPADYARCNEGSVASKNSSISRTEPRTQFQLQTQLAARFWPIFARVNQELSDRGFQTEASVFQAMAEHYGAKPEKPFDHIVVDEAQDLGVPELRFLISIAPEVGDALFFAGDLGQRIFQQPFSWQALGVDVRGRSHTLKVNYRTSHQIRQAADRLLPGTVSDVDGRDEDRRGTVSVFNGPDPFVVLANAIGDEIAAVAAFLKNAIAAGVNPEEIGVFVRTRDVLGRARDAVIAAGHQAWSIADVEQFEAHWPLGTKPRLAMALMLYTGARRSDAVRLGRQHVTGGRLRWTAYKNRNRHPVQLDMPVLPELAEAIAARPTGRLMFLDTEQGKSFSIDGFGGWFRDKCDAAGLPACSCHGLRKAGSTRAAENGATAHELMAMFGWKNLAEAEHYTRSADRNRLSTSAAIKLSGRRPEPKP